MRTKQHRFDVLRGNAEDALHKICSLRLRMSGWSLGKMCSQQAVNTESKRSLSAFGPYSVHGVNVWGRTHLTVFGGLCQSRPSHGIDRRQSSHPVYELLYFVRPLRMWCRPNLLVRGRTLTQTIN
jgi:hypothetical protein